MPDPSTAATYAGWKAAARIGKWAWDHQDEVEPKLKALYRSTKRRIFGRAPGILVLGAGGVGKTTLGRILSGRYDFLFDTDGEYEQSVGVQTFRHKNSPDVELIVAPGQEDRRAATWATLLNRLTNGKELGVILCCAYGHHSLSSSYKYHKLYASDPPTFLSRFLANRRSEEVRILDDIAQSLAQNTHRTWLLTVVGKEDLWADEEQSVQDFYTTGAYGKAVSELMKVKGNRLFRHELAFGSLVIRNLTTARNEKLKDNLAGYDHLRQVNSLRRLFEAVEALENWKVN